MTKKNFPSINGIRAISILLVIFSHLVLQNSINQLIGVKKFSPIYYDFTLYGSLGVNVFFVISGFLITSLMIGEENDQKQVSLKKFYARRTLRIFPAYFFLLFIYFLLQLMGVIYISNTSWLSALTYTKYFNWRLDWYTSHIWSLSIEEQFYLFWPLIFICGNKLRKNVAIILFLLVPIVRIITHYHPVSWVNQLSIFTRIDGIALGCLCALYQDNILKILSKNWALFVSLAVSIIFLWNEIISIFLHFNIPIGFFSLPLGLDNGTMEKVSIAIIIMYSIFGPKGLWFKVINLKILNYIGTLSYSIYLWQQLFIDDTNRWFNQFPVNMVCVAGSALFSYYLIERPFLKIKNKFEIPAKKANEPDIQNHIKVNSGL